jgi:hypothetical protein
MRNFLGFTQIEGGVPFFRYSGRLFNLIFFSIIWLVKCEQKSCQAGGLSSLSLMGEQAVEG